MNLSALSVLPAGLWSLLLIILFFGGSIFVHELGHFLAARWRGLKIERFSIGFPPKLWSRRYRGVEYSIGALPLGGYVALPQLAEMPTVEGKTASGREPLPPISYADKVIVAAAGAFFNILFALLLAALLWGFGEPIPQWLQSTQIGYVSPEVVDAEGKTVPGPAFQAGLRPGDTLIRVDGEPVKDWQEVAFAIVRGAGRTADRQPLTRLTIRRDGRLLDLEVTPVLHTAERLRHLGIAPGAPITIAKIFPNSPMQRAGLQAGDVLLSVDQQPVLSLQSLNQYVQNNGERPLTLRLQRNGTILEKIVTPQQVTITNDGELAYKLGFKAAWETVTIQRNPLEQISSHIHTTLQTLGALINRNTDIGLSQLSGPPGIAYAIHKLSSVDIRYVLGLIVLININLAILNLLPIPVLDGGHILFATLGKLRGQALPARFVQGVQGAFVILLLGLMAYVMINDTVRVSRDIRASQAEQRRLEALDRQYIDPVFTAPTDKP